MLLLVNSTKTMSLEGPLPARLAPTEPAFAVEAGHLAAALRALSAARLARAQGVTGDLADRARGELARWGAEGRPRRPAVFAFTGLVYQGLAPGGFAAPVRRRAAARLRILSGLYGVLRPFDLVEAYRLEMGSPLGPDRAANLAAWWKPRLTAALDAELADGEPVITVAAQEYMKAVDVRALKGPVISPVFKEERPDGSLKTVTVHAKKARGALLRFALVSGARRPADLLGFDEDGWAAAGPPPERGDWLFTRPERG
ncbi:MAG TPA: YaaA family protein [Candidatus Krumholzibacteria bacterium]|nr:YaaA family protein [Candidatus Krumholzibacteria bacterium]